jgi:predicted HTH domain antitoxin
MNMQSDEMLLAMRREYGLKQYQAGKLTLSQTADFCGVTLYELASLLTLSSIPVIDYAGEELECELKQFSKRVA